MYIWSMTFNWFVKLFILWFVNRGLRICDCISNFQRPVNLFEFNQFKPTPQIEFQFVTVKILMELNNYFYNGGFKNDAITLMQFQRERGRNSDEMVRLKLFSFDAAERKYEHNVFEHFANVTCQMIDELTTWKHELWQKPQNIKVIKCCEDIIAKNESNNYRRNGNNMWPERTCPNQFNLEIGK